MVSRTLLLSLAAGLVAAQRPANTSICDFYTTALLKENNATNQLTLLTLVVNTAVIGNYTKPNVGVMVPGILATDQMFNGVPVNLLQYFDGMLDSSNRGGSSGVSVNFLDGGGAAPLMMNMAANNTMSNQFTLLTHLYEFFGLLLGCTEVGMTGFPAYAGETSMYQVHKFMDLDVNEVGYFIEQVGLSAKSFGVADADVTAVGTALTKLFSQRCAPAAAIVPKAPAQLQAICIDSDCPESANATCSAYAPAMEPMNATSPTSNSSSPSSSTPAVPSSTTNGAQTRFQAGTGLALFLVLGAMAWMC